MSALKESSRLTYSPVNDRLCFALGIINAQARRAFNAALQPFGIDTRHYGVLSVALNGSAVSQQKAGQLLEIDRATMVSLVDELEAKNLVKRTKDPTDRRAYLIKVTTQGKQLYKKATVAADSCQTELWPNLSERQKTTLHELLALAIAKKTIT